MDDHMRYKLEYLRWFAANMIKWPTQIVLQIAGTVLYKLGEILLNLYAILRDWQPKFPRSVRKSVPTSHDELYNSDDPYIEGVADPYGKTGPSER